MCSGPFLGPVWGPSNVFPWSHAFVKCESYFSHSHLGPQSLSSPTYPVLHSLFCRLVLERPRAAWDSAKGKLSWRHIGFMLRRLYVCGSLSYLVKLLLAILVQGWLQAISPLPTLAMPEAILGHACDLFTRHWKYVGIDGETSFQKCEAEASLRKFCQSSDMYNYKQSIWFSQMPRQKFCPAMNILDKQL